MDKADLGLKFTCVNCAARSFDLKRTPVVCPKCGTEQPVIRRRVIPGARAPARQPMRGWTANKAPAALPVDAEDAELIVADEDEDDVVPDDADTIDADPLDDDEVVEAIVPKDDD